MKLTRKKVIWSGALLIAGLALPTAISIWISEPEPPVRTQTADCAAIVAAVQAAQLQGVTLVVPCVER